jgi:hypothetical protein
MMGRRQATDKGQATTQRKSDTPVRTSDHSTSLHPTESDPPATGLGDITESVEDKIEESLYETFPASDPPAWNPAGRVGSPKRKTDS